MAIQTTDSTQHVSGKLNGSVTYLVGSIDYSPDCGVGWRAEVRQKLIAAGLGAIKVIDPCQRTEGLPQDVGEEQSKINQYKAEKNWTALQSLMKPIVRADLRCIDCSDFIIAYIERDIHMCGSYHEIVCCLSQKKPVMVVVKGGRQNASSWLFGICDVETMFDDFDSMVDYLKKLNDGTIPLSKKWVLFRQVLESLGH